MITCTVTLIPDGRFQGHEIENQELDRCHNCRKSQSKSLNIRWKVESSMKSWQGPCRVCLWSKSYWSKPCHPAQLQPTHSPSMWKQTVEKKSHKCNQCGNTSSEAGSISTKINSSVLTHDIGTIGRGIIRMQTHLLLLFSCWPQVMSCSQPNRWSVPIAGAHLI